MTKKEVFLLKNKICVRRKFFNFILIAIDYFAGVFLKKRKIPEGFIPKKLLVCNIAHLGDFVSVLRVIQWFKKLYPTVKVGVLCSSVVYELARLAPEIEWIYLYDHWKLNRVETSFIKKIYRFFKTRSKALYEIKKAKYDLAIDLYFFFPNCAYFLFKTRIPYTIGYHSGGFGNFYKDCYEVENKPQYNLFFHRDLLIKSGLIKSCDISCLSDKYQYNFREKVDLPFSEYIILQLGSGSCLKTWPEEKWYELAVLLEEKNYNLIFTGAGQSENETIEKIVKKLKRAKNLCSQLSFEKLFFLVQKASLAISVDSLMNHICALFQTPNLIIFSGLSNIDLWLPDNEKIDYITNEISCAPCYKKFCDDRSCIVQISPEQVLKKALALIN